MNTGEAKWRELFKDCGDVVFLRLPHGDLLFYCQGLLGTKQLHEWVIPRLEADGEGLNLLPLKGDNVEEQVIRRVFAGQLLILAGNEALQALDIANPPNRKTEESSMEVTIKGAKDAFIEDLATNVALIRKRLRSPQLCYETFTIGKLSQTEVGLLYMRDIAKPEIVEEARRRLRKIETDVITVGFLEEELAEYSTSFFPMTQTTTRADFTMFCLVNGRFVVLMQGAPSVIVAPATLALQLKSAEDEYNPYFLVAFGRFLRFLGLMIAMFVPGFWICLTSYHMDQMPMPLLATATMSRLGLPMSPVFEALLMQLMFELFREAGMRLPSAIGQTVAVVGGLIVGDAAVRAGMTSPGMLVIMAVSAVATFTLVNPSLNVTVTVLRLIVLSFSAFLGLFGFFVAMFGIILYLSRLQSYGVPYLAPFTPLKPKELISAMFKKPRRYAEDQPSFVVQNKPKGEGQG